LAILGGRDADGRDDDSGNRDSAGNNHDVNDILDGGSGQASSSLPNTKQ
jgi:hypothetical protein